MSTNKLTPSSSVFTWRRWTPTKDNNDKIKMIIKQNVILKALNKSGLVFE
jgi:hypothetical protein